MAAYPRRKLDLTQPMELPLHGKLKRLEYSKEELVELWQRLAAGGLEKDYKYGRNPGQFTVEDTKNVPKEIGELPAASARLIREKLPAVARRLEP